MVVVVVVVVDENSPQKVPPKDAQFSGVVRLLILKQAQNPPEMRCGNTVIGHVLSTASLAGISTCVA